MSSVTSKLWMIGFALLLSCVWPLTARAERILVFAASSLKTALDEVAEEFAAQTGHQVVPSYAGSSALARQIQLGAPADLFISANPGWMDVLEADGLIVADTRADLMSNTLVLVGGEAPRGEALADHLAQGRVAMALVDAVPVGIYGKEALSHLGLWEDVAPRVVQADNARAALAFVALGEVPFGIVYGSDVLSESRVFELAVFPAESHRQIRYPAAILDGRDSLASRDFLAFLQGGQAQETFARSGFAVLEGP